MIYRDLAGYRAIIRKNLREAVIKKDNAKTENERKYWEWIIGQLLEDLRDYEGRGVWRREPYDEAWKKYRPHTHLSVDEILRRFFEGDLW